MYFSYQSLDNMTVNNNVVIIDKYIIYIRIGSNKIQLIRCIGLEKIGHVGNIKMGISAKAFKR